MKDALVKLLKVSSLISLIFVISYVISVFVGIQNDKFSEMVSLIIVFYYGTQVGKSMNK